MVSILAFHAGYQGSSPCIGTFCTPFQNTHPTKHIFPQHFFTQVWDQLKFRNWTNQLFDKFISGHNAIILMSESMEEKTILSTNLIKISKYCDMIGDSQHPLRLNFLHSLYYNLQIPITANLYQDGSCKCCRCIWWYYVIYMLEWWHVITCALTALIILEMPLS